MRAVFLDYETISYSDLATASLMRVVPALRLYDNTADSQLIERIEHAEIVLLNKIKLSRAALEAAPQLRLIAVAGTGTDHIDLACAEERAIGVCNVRGYCTQSVAQLVWSMILCLTHHLPAYQRLAIAGAWAGSPQFGAAGVGATAPRIRELNRLVLGIVGWGELGRAVARIGESFGMRVLAANRPGGGMRVEGKARPQRLELRALLATADVLSLHCPLTEHTRGMIGAAELALMKSDALLINTARGGLVDSAALAEALKAGRLGGAGIDVLAQEPPAEGDPLLDTAIPNLVLTPHIAWAAREARQRCLDEMAANIQDFLSGGRRGRVV
jgi:glycerate dehydrogenase